MAYSDVKDLLLGDITLGDSVNPLKWVMQAADDMDAKLGFVYQLPITPKGGSMGNWQGLPTHEVLLLKGINNKLASGRLILTLAIAGEGTTLHAYGWQLVREATAELTVLANQDIMLTAELRSKDVDDESSRIASIHNHDEESLVDAFENTVMRGRPSWTQPGRLYE